MGDDAKTVTLSEAESALVDSLIESGEYASVEEVVHAAMGVLIAQRDSDAVPLDDAELERWLREDVMPTYERVQAGEPTLSIEEVKAALREDSLQSRRKSG